MAGNRALLVDLDGTLTDNFNGIARSIRHALTALGVPEPAQGELFGCIGPPLRTSFARLLATDEPALIERAIVHYRERYADIGWQENTVYDGVEPALAALVARGEVLYLCTSKPLLYAERIVTHFGLRPYLARAYGADLAGTLDDKANLVAHVVRRERLDVGGCVMVGDREQDVRAAHANGMRAIGALWGYGSRDELVAADALAESPHAVTAALDVLRGAISSNHCHKVYG